MNAVFFFLWETYELFAKRVNYHSQLTSDMCMFVFSPKNAKFEKFPP
jgi:hypothetical protein